MWVKQFSFTDRGQRIVYRPKTANSRPSPVAIPDKLWYSPEGMVAERILRSRRRAVGSRRVVFFFVGFFAVIAACFRPQERNERKRLSVRLFQGAHRTGRALRAEWIPRI
jgi:hypothetical protein